MTDCQEGFSKVVDSVLMDVARWEINIPEAGLKP